PPPTRRHGGASGCRRTRTVGLASPARGAGRHSARSCPRDPHPDLRRTGTTALGLATILGRAGARCTDHHHGAPAIDSPQRDTIDAGVTLRANRPAESEGLPGRGATVSRGETVR